MTVGVVMKSHVLAEGERKKVLRLLYSGRRT